MKAYLVFADEAAAQRRNRELMDAGRAPGNPDRDGKPYVTQERHTLRTANDGSAVLEVDDEQGLTTIEKSKLLKTRPAKFDPPLEEELAATPTR